MVPELPIVVKSLSRISIHLPNIQSGDGRAYLISLNLLNLLVYLVLDNIGRISSLALLGIRNRKGQSGGDGRTSMNARRGHIDRGRSRVHGPMRCVVIFILLWCKVSNQQRDDERLEAIEVVDI